MKIAKKLLAAVIAVMLVCSLTVCAFATDPEAVGTVFLKADTSVAGQVKVQAVITGGAELKSADWVLLYDDELTMTTADPANGTGDYTQIMNDIVLMSASNGNLMTAYNSLTKGEIQIGFAFKETLGTDAETVLFTVDFAVADGAENVEIVLNEKDGTFVDSLVLFEAEAEEPTPAPEEPTPAPEEPTPAPEEPTPAPEAPATRPVEDDDDDCRPGKPGHDNCKPNKPACKPVKPGKPSHKHPNTGDSAALAAAAGVVLLAGAAFVVSKKRK